VNADNELSRRRKRLRAEEASDEPCALRFIVTLKYRVGGGSFSGYSGTEDSLIVESLAIGYREQ